MFRVSRLLLSCLLLTACAFAFVPSPFLTRSCRDNALRHAQPAEPPKARLVGYVSNDERENLEQALRNAGYIVSNDEDSVDCVYQYSFARATGMLKLVDSPGDEQEDGNAPRWVPLVQNFETVLVNNGWSFLDPDTDEPMSPFDIDAANAEGLYKPKWGNDDDKAAENEVLSDLGYSLRHMSVEEVTQAAASLQDEISRSVLLEGDTDRWGIKRTHNGFVFDGAASQSDIPRGIFVCAIGGLPLFATTDLPPSTASSGWLSFTRPLSQDHVVLVRPNKNEQDQRVEVVCAKSGCHLGHFFGKGEGYCINASALNFIALTDKDEEPSNNEIAVQYPVSWRSLEGVGGTSAQLLEDSLRKTSLVQTETVALGVGCFWHVEFALRRLPGVVSTEVGYAGGTVPSPSYEDVCNKETGHAEVVRITFDPIVLDRRILVDCFLALHDPTKGRAHGKHAQRTGQYRSCVFTTSEQMKTVAQSAFADCQTQLKKELCTEVRKMDSDNWFWRAEDRHQRHDEKRKESASDAPSDLSTLSVTSWLKEYGKRSETILGSAETLSSLTAV